MNSLLKGLIEDYERGGNKLAGAIAGLSNQQMRAVPIPGKWSTHQLVIHLADGDAGFADRIRRIVAMDDPVLLAWDENQFSANLFYEKQSAEDAVAIIQLTRRQLGRVLRAMPESAFSRTGEHSHRGTQTLSEVIESAVNHLDHHLKFVAEKREKMGL